jgi:hypothetical protein
MSFSKILLLGKYGYAIPVRNLLDQVLQASIIKQERRARILVLSKDHAAA